MASIELQDVHQNILWVCVERFSNWFLTRSYLSPKTLYLSSNVVDLSFLLLLCCFQLFMLVHSSCLLVCLFMSFVGLSFIKTYEYKLRIQATWFTISPFLIMTNQFWGYAFIKDFESNNNALCFIESFGEDFTKKILQEFPLNMCICSLKGRLSKKTF